MIAGVWKVLVAVGDIVSQETVLVILEAMKMEVSIRSPKPGQKFKVDAIFKDPGERVQAGDPLILLNPVA
jgi:biotin carboxyl carrier protein